MPKSFVTANFIVHHSSMRVSISTLTGVEVARLDTDATVTLVELLALLPNEVDDTECSRRIFFGESELKGYVNHSEHCGRRGQRAHCRIWAHLTIADRFRRPDREGVVDCLV